MSTSTPRKVGLVSVLLASSCTRIGAVDSRTSGSAPVATSMAPSEEATPSVQQQSRQHATVVTSAGRIEADAVDGHLDLEVVSAIGWEPSIDRGDNAARVVWTSAGRSVEVRIRSSATGISQEVVTTG